MRLIIALMQPKKKYCVEESKNWCFPLLVVCMRINWVRKLIGCSDQLSCYAWRLKLSLQVSLKSEIKGSDHREHAASSTTRKYHSIETDGGHLYGHLSYNRFLLQYYVERLWFCIVDDISFATNYHIHIPCNMFAPMPLFLFWLFLNFYISGSNWYIWRVSNLLQFSLNLWTFCRISYFLFIQLNWCGFRCGASFTIEVVSEKFEGKRLLERHRLVNAALEEEMKQIHALSIKKALTPEQWKQQQESEKPKPAA